MAETQDWTKEGITAYRKSMRESERAARWAELKKRMQNAAPTIKKMVKAGESLENWWDKECWEKTKSC